MSQILPTFVRRCKQSSLHVSHHSLFSFVRDPKVYLTCTQELSTHRYHVVPPFISSSSGSPRWCPAAKGPVMLLPPTAELLASLCHGLGFLSLQRPLNGGDLPHVCRILKYGKLPSPSFIGILVKSLSP